MAGPSLFPSTAGWTSASDQSRSGEPTGVIAGRSGLYRVFHCTHCPDAHPRVDLR
jgi:hypothetical protein